MLTYLLVRFFAFFLALLPLRALRTLGKFFGTLVYYGYPTFRKKALANLSIAYGEGLSEKELKTLARQSFQNLMISLLEFPKLAQKGIENWVELKNFTKVMELSEQKVGMIFLTGHQANWEIPFILANHLSPGGVAIGRHVRNPYLYKWVLSIRESRGGKIVTPRQAIKESLRALKKGKYVGIVGDQAHPASPYSYPLFGTRAWITNAPALIAYKARVPIVVVRNKRTKKGYELDAAPPLWPNYELPFKEAVKELMDQSLSYLESSFKERPAEWMWIHDQWKQQGIDHVRREYRFAFILVLLPKEESHLPALFAQIYPRSFVTFKREGEKLCVRDYRYQLVIDCRDLPKVRKFYKKLGAARVLYLPPDQVKERLVKKECQHIVST